MAIVISDTSSIRALAHLQQLDLLHELFGEVWVPPAVDFELRNPSAGLAAVDVGQYSFILIRAPQDQARVQQFLQFLDAGESEALVLALENPTAVLLVDEADARAEAQQLGLNYTGVLGVLLRAKARGRIPAVAPLMAALENDLGFFISGQLRNDVLRAAGEMP